MKPRCKHCQAEYPGLIGWSMAALARHEPILKAISEAQLPASVTLDKLVSQVGTLLYKELHSAKQMAETGLCGLCAIASAPGACVHCWAVAATELSLDEDGFQAKLKRRREELVAAGHSGRDLTGGWHKHSDP